MYAMRLVLSVDFEQGSPCDGINQSEWSVKWTESSEQLFKIKQAYNESVSELKRKQADVKRMTRELHEVESTNSAARKNLSESEAATKMMMKKSQDMSDAVKFSRAFVVLIRIAR